MPRIVSSLLRLSPGVETGINLRFNPGADDREPPRPDHGGMTTTEYLLNAAFVVLVLRQSRVGTAGNGLEAIELARSAVKTHVNHIFAKAGARDRAQAVRYAYQHGLA